MKTILMIAIAIFLSNTLYATELSWVDEQIEAIKPPRKSLKLKGIKDPFIFLKEKQKAKKTSAFRTKRTASKVSDKTAAKMKIMALNLSTVINSSAMINGSWYKKDAKVRGYTVVEVAKTSVTLKKGDKKMILSTNSKNQNIKFKNK
jgi:mannitol-specific phosphotransferase system IIBC component